MSRVGGERPSGAARTPGLDEAVELVRAVVAANVAGAVELVDRIDALVRRVAAGGPPPAPGPWDLPGRLVEAGIAAWAEVGGHALAALEGLVSVAERALVPTPAAAREEAPGPAVAVAAAPGDRIPFRLAVENRYDGPVEVGFRADRWTGPEGGGGPRPGAVVVAPARLRVGPGATVEATATIPVGRAVRPGATFSTTVRLTGFEADGVPLALTVVENAPAPGAAPEGERPSPVLVVDRTPANDLYRALSGLGLATEAERLLADPLSFVADHRAEAHLVAGWLRGLAAAIADARAGGRADEPAAPRAGGPPSQAAEELHRSPSLLR